MRYLTEVGHDLSDIEKIRRFALPSCAAKGSRPPGIRREIDLYYLESLAIPTAASRRRWRNWSRRASL